MNDLILKAKRQIQETQPVQETLYKLRGVFRQSIRLYFSKFESSQLKNVVSNDAREISQSSPFGTGWDDESERSGEEEESEESETIDEEDENEEGGSSGEEENEESETIDEEEENEEGENSGKEEESESAKKRQRHLSELFQ